MSEEELTSLQPEVVRILPEETARVNMVVAIERSARQLVVATADPLNVLALDEVRRVTGLDVEVRITSRAAIQAAIQRHHRWLTTERDDETVRQELGLTVLSGTGAEDTVDLKQLRTQADVPPVVKLVNYMLTRSACDGASDIHVEPFEDRTIIRYRIDGLLYELLEVPRQLHLAVVSRLKIISRLDIAERRLPQDGSFAARVNDAEIDFRVSTLPTIHGEKVVLRLLLKEAVVRHYTLEGLGFYPDQLALFRDAIRRPWGMILMTGPTGSGKSTTLHTALKAIKSPRKNIVTVEDPVEYRQPGIHRAGAEGLIRKMCAHCKESYEPGPDARVVLTEVGCPDLLSRGRGCRRCRNPGFAGRIALFEVLRITADVRGLILSGFSADRIQKLALESGMIPLRLAGLRKVAQGVTTLEEVLAVVADQE